MPMTFTSWTRTDMDQMVMARAVTPASSSADEDVFHYPDGVTLPPSHPGDTLADELAVRGLTANALALKLRVPANRISDIVRERRGLTADTAIRLGRYFGTDPGFWLNMQQGYELSKAQAETDYSGVPARASTRAF